MTVRSGEKNKNWFRCQRLLHVNNAWVFITREHTEEGPFDSIEEAEIELMLYLRYVNSGMFSALKSAS